MAKIVCLLVCLVAAVHMSYSLDCYSCESSNNNQACEKFDKANVPTVSCGKAVANYKSVCLKRVVRSTSDSSRLNVTRKCILAAPNTKTEDLSDCKPSQGWQSVECVTCEEDLCNAASSRSLTAYAAMGVVLSYVVARCLLY